jgi:Protein of unknown function (DUF4013)
MNFGRAFSYAFQDPDWIKKVGIAAVICIIPVLGSIIVLGWALEITRRVIRNEPEFLPDWSNFGDYLSKGFQAFVVTLVFLLPGLLLNVCQQAVNYGHIAAANSGNSNQFGMIANIAVICLSCVSIVFSIAAGFLTPAAIGVLADTGQLSAAFRFNQIIALVRAAPGPYLLQLIVVWLTSVILLPIGLLVCVVGVFAAIAYLSLVTAHLYGQSYKLARSAMAASGSSM